MENTITSRQNPQVQYLKSLHQKKYRDREGKFLIEGWRFVGEALEAGVPVEKVVFSTSAREDRRYPQLLAVVEDREIQLIHMADNVLVVVAETEQPQGVVALVRQTETDLESILQKNAEPFLLVVDGIRDPGNLGTVIRTADAAGMTAVVLLPGTADLYNGKTLRSTMGSVFHLPICNSDTAVLTELLRDRGIPLLAADVAGDAPVYSVPLTGTLAIAVGSEVEGASKEILQAAQHRVTIPMPGRAESLNAAVASGIIIFEAVRQRAGNP